MDTNITIASLLCAHAHVYISRSRDQTGAFAHHKTIFFYWPVLCVSSSLIKWAKENKNLTVQKKLLIYQRHQHHQRPYEIQNFKVLKIKFRERQSPGRPQEWAKSGLRWKSWFFSKVRSWAGWFPMDVLIPRPWCRPRSAKWPHVLRNAPHIADDRL